MTALVWFRRDLRVHDQPALRAALAEHERIVPVFCLDDHLLHGRHASGSRTQFLLESLADLDASLRERGGALVVRRGRPERELLALARETGAEAVFLTGEDSPFARGRGALARGAFAEAELEVRVCPGLTVVDDVNAIRTQNGGPYAVFSPFWRNWRGCARRDVLAAPRKVELPHDVEPGQIPSLADLGLEQEVVDPPAGGEAAGRERMRAWLRSGAARYHRRHDSLDTDGTSRLSPYLHLGCVSPRELEQRLPSGEGAAAFDRQLCWRDFYHHVLGAFPDNARHEFQSRYRDLRCPTRKSASRPGPRGGPGSRWSTRACASCAARAGCTTARGWWWARS